MQTIVIDYRGLSKVSKQAEDLSSKALEYANDLSRNIYINMDDIAGAISNNIESAKYYVNAKISELNRKKEAYQSFAKSVNNLMETAKRVDKEVAVAIADNQERFLKNNDHLRISEWKAKMLNWLVDIKNTCPIFEMIGNKAYDKQTNLSGLSDYIKHWYKCEGGKETLAIVGAVLLALAAIAAAIAAWPAAVLGSIATVFVKAIAIAKFIGATITAINAVVNIATSIASRHNAKYGDPAWAKIYGDQDKASDYLRQTNFKGKDKNKFATGLANTLDGLQLIGDMASGYDAIKTFEFKPKSLKNFFDKETGLLSYMKTKKFKYEILYGENGYPVGSKKIFIKDEYGEDAFMYTPSSIFKGFKNFISNKPIDGEIGIRSALTSNFKNDFKGGLKKLYTPSEWKKAIDTSIKDTKKDIDIIFEKGKKFGLKKEAFKNTGEKIQSVETIMRLTGKVTMGEFDIKSDTKDILKECSNIVALYDQMSELRKSSKSYLKNLNINNDGNGINEGKILYN